MTLNKDILTIATIGMFDGVHRGHQDLLECLKREAAASGLTPLVLTFDRHPLSLIRPEMAPKLLVDTDQKVALLRAHGVERVELLPFDEQLRRLTAEEFIALIARQYGVRRLVMGYDHAFGSDRLSDFSDYVSAAARHGVSVVQCAPYIDPTYNVAVSSSKIRRALTDGDIERANTLLGRPYELSGEVISGRQLGRTIGFPTANLSVSPERLVPAPGVYACVAHLNNTPYPAAVNVGTCPTVTAQPNEPSAVHPTQSAAAQTIEASAAQTIEASVGQTIEAHLIDFNGDIYNRPLSLTWHHRLRSERRFDSLTALQSQLKLDRQSTLNIVAPH